MQVITNIRRLVNTAERVQPLRGADLADLPGIDDAFLIIEDGLIADFGAMYELELRINKLPHDHFDAKGAFVMPAWCDSHTHLVFAATREDEFIQKLQGATYAEIAAKGGGIVNSAKKLNEAPEEELFNSALDRLQQLMKLGTGAIEIKSGYGLTVEGELKMLRVIKRLRSASPVTIRSTFLGAHTFPAEFKENHEGYINAIINEMLPVIAEEQLADYIDVFCETGFFSAAEMERICQAGMSYGLKPKVHVNQLNSIGGIQSAIKMGAVSADHLETMTEQDIKDLAASDVIGTLLPTAAFFLRMPFQPARDLIKAGAAIAVASDYNPGSSPSGNMNFVIALSCIQMKLLPEEAINAATVNGAFAMGIEKELGSVAIGKKANLIFTKPMNSLAYLPYSFGSNLVDKVMINGRFV